MATKYRVKINSIATDGTNLFLEIGVFDGEHTFPPIRPSFPVGTTAATITAYVQQIADNTPTLAADIGDLVGSEVTQS